MRQVANENEKAAEGGVKYRGRQNCVWETGQRTYGARERPEEDPWDGLDLEEGVCGGSPEEEDQRR